MREEVTNLRSQITVLMSRSQLEFPHQSAWRHRLQTVPWQFPPSPPPVPNAPVSGDRRRWVCRRSGCDTAVATGCCVQFCQAHCASPRCRVHGQRARNSDRSCRHPGCEARVPPECTSFFCQSHCNSRRCQVHMNRPRCSTAECDSPPAPGCLVGACVAHCDHWQCSRARMGRGRNSRRSHVLSNICWDPSCDERVHPDCSSRRCTLHCTSRSCAFHSTAILAQEPFLAQGGHCLCVVRQVELGVVFACSSLRRSEMPRRGWQTVEVPAGWFEVIRGRRPKSESWPKAERKGSVVHNQIAAEVVSPGATVPHRQFNPAATRGAPQKRPFRLHAHANWPCVCLRRESRFGLRGVRVGEASHPGTPRPRRRRDLNLPPTQVDSDIDDDERMLPRRQSDAVGEAACRARDVPLGRASVPVREFDMGMDDSSSDTETVATVPEPPPSLLDALEQDLHPIPRGVRGRRLRLHWRAPQVWHREARGAVQLVRDLASRIGPIPIGAEVPRAVRQQRWSPLNVPLMWGAASTEDTTPVMEWLVATTIPIEVPLEFHEGGILPSEALRVGWSSLTEVMRGWGIQDREDLSIWLRNHGFAGTAPGNHIAARAQEFLLNEAVAVDARVALLEPSMCVSRCT